MPLRDAAVDPDVNDFLPPINAGAEDPHGPLVASPEIHGDKPGGLLPGPVSSDPVEQELEESALAEAILIDGADKPTAVAAAGAANVDGDES